MSSTEKWIAVAVTGAALIVALMTYHYTWAITIAVAAAAHYFHRRRVTNTSR